MFLSRGEIFESMTSIKLNVYSLSKHNGWLGAIGLGVFHSGIEVDGVEYSFSSAGVSRGAGMPGARFRETVEMGSVATTTQAIGLAVAELAVRFAPGTYNVVSNNCNDFSDSFCRALLGKGIPSWINRAASLGSPFMPSAPNAAAASVAAVAAHPVLNKEEVRQLKESNARAKTEAREREEAKRERPELSNKQRDLLAKLKAR